MNRTWELELGSAAQEPPTGVPVRTYFSEADFQAINSTVTGLNSVNDLTFYKLINNPYSSAMAALIDHHQNITPADIALFTNASFQPISNVWTSGGNATDGWWAEYTVPSFSGGGGGGANNGNPPFPLVLQSFTGYEELNHNILEWATASEFNTSHFELERSADNLLFTSIASVPASGYSSSVISYSQRDYAPFNGSNFYRLKMIDMDGSYKYSNTIELNFEHDIYANVYPNPVKDLLHISFLGISHHASANIVLYDPTGRMVMSERWEVEGNFLKEVSVKNLAAGVYHYQLVVDDRPFYGKVTKSE
jgi:hypothetical protein